MVAALSRGPVSISFLAPYVDQIIADQYPALHLGFDELELQWDGRDKNLVFGVSNISVAKDNKTVAYIPDVTVTFSQAALMKGRLAPSGLEFNGLKLRLTRSAEGEVKLGYTYGLSEEHADKPSTDFGQGDVGADTLHQMLAELGQRKSSSDLTAYLERLEIYQSALYVEDIKLQKTWRVTSADMIIWKSDKGVSGRLQGSANLGDQKIKIQANMLYDRRLKTTTITSSVTDFPIPLIAEEFPEIERLKGVKLPVSGDFNLSLDRRFEPSQISFVLKVGEGVIDMPDLYKEPLPIELITLEGHSMAPFNGINVNAAYIKSLGAEINMAGSIAQLPEGISLSLEGSIPEVQTNNLKKYWPYSAAVDGYNWVTQKITNGYARNAQFSVELPAGSIESGNIPEGAVKLEFDVEGVSTDYFAPLPIVTEISGHSILTEKQIHLYNLKGKVLDLDVTGGDVLIYDFDQPTQNADIALTVEGQSKTIFEFLDRKPLELASPFGIRPDAMQGTGRVEAQFVFPLKDDLQLENVQFEAKGQFWDAYIPNVFEEYDLSGANMAALVTPEKLTVRGKGLVSGVSADISFQSWFKGDRKGVKRYEVQTALTADDRLKLDLMNSDYLTGTVATSLAVDVSPAKRAKGLVTLNLIEAGIDIPDLKLNKPVGVAGLFGAQFRTDGSGGAHISNIRLGAENIEVTGYADFDAKGLSQLTADRVSFGENDLTLKVTRAGDNKYAASVTGRVFDLRPFVVDSYSLNDGKAEETAEKTPDILVDIALEKILLDADVVLKNMTGSVDYSENVVRQGNIHTTIGKDKSLTIIMSQTLNGRHLEFTTDHVGQLFQGLDLYDNMREGNLKIVADIDDTKEESVATGQVEMKDIRIVNAPVLGKILTVGSLTGIVELLQNEGMTFATVEGPFTYENGLIRTKNFRAVGSIGLTFTGTVDQRQKKMNAFGTVIPSYTLNSILGNIPILGRLLVGREGEGIFGFSYKVEGDTDNPEVFVNPVSALAPGILRRMFFEPWGSSTEIETEKKNVPQVEDKSEKEDQP
jgi:AsmA-like C-terminal region/Protein of unknown function